MKLNTGHFTDTYFPDLDSISVIVKNFVFWLNHKYGSSFVATSVQPDETDDDPFDVYRFNKEKKLIEKIKDKDLDIIHVHDPFDTGRLGLKIAKDYYIPIIGTIHKDYFKEIKQNVKIDLIAKRKIKNLITFYNQLNFLYADSELLVDSLRYYGYEGDVEVIPSGTDFVYDRELVEKEKSYIEHLYEIEPETNVLLYVGELTWQKNMQLLIDSLINLRKLRQKFKMIFVGDGYAREEMIRLVEENKLKRYVLFVGEINDRDQLKKYYMRANLLLYPQATYSASLVIREAAAYHCPTLVLKNVSNMIKDNYNGYLSENNSLSYAQRIISALNDRNKDEVGKNAQDTLITPYEKIIDQVFEKYCEFI